MGKHPVSFVNVKDPYCLLAIAILKQAFEDIGIFFSKEGTPDEIKEGRKGLRWIRRMEGTFRTVSIASDMSLERLHQLSLEKINKIKMGVFQRKYATKRLGQ